MAQTSTDGSDPLDPFDDAFQERLELLAVSAKRLAAGRDRGHRRSQRPGAGVEFADHRAYAPGDDFRYIDWSAYARLGRLLLRLYEQEEDLSIHLLIDRSLSMGLGHPSKLFHAKRLAAALAYVSLHNLDRVSLVGLGGDGHNTSLPPGRGRGRIFSVLDFLRALPCQGTTDLAGSLRRFTTAHRRRGVAILLSDLFDPAGFERGLDALRFARFETHVLHITSPEDAEPALNGEVLLRDVESGASRPVSISPRVRRSYQAHYQAFLTRVQRHCAEKHISLAQLSTRTPVDEAVLGILRRGGLVAR